MLCGIVSAASFILSAIPLLGFVVFAIVGLSYLVIQTGAGIWLMVIAFQEEVAQGLLYLFVPFYALYYLITRWETCRLPFMLCMVSLVSLVCSLPGLLIGTIVFGAMMGEPPP